MDPTCRSSEERKRRRGISIACSFASIIGMKNQRHQTLAQFQSRTAIFNIDECVRILEQFQWNCLEAINYVLEEIDATRDKRPNSTVNLIRLPLKSDQPLIPNECLNELEGIRHFERVFQERHENVSRWPVWFKASLDSAINQSRSPFAVFLNHDGSSFAKTFSRQVLCSPSILNVLSKYKCNLWPWDVTYPLNKQRLLDRSGRARSILAECFAYFPSVDSYPLLLLLSRHNDRVVLLDVVNGNWDLDQTRACLERTLNPIVEQSMIFPNETASLSPGWVGGRTAGNIRRRPYFVTRFHSSRSLRATQRPRYVSYYEPKHDRPERIVTLQEAKEWLRSRKENGFTSSCLPIAHQRSHPMRLDSSTSSVSPIPSLSVTTKGQLPKVRMSSRRAGWASLVNR